MRWLPPVQPWIIRMLVWRFLFCDFARQIRQGLIRFPRFGRKSWGLLQKSELSKAMFSSM